MEKGKIVKRILPSGPAHIPSTMREAMEYFDGVRIEATFGPPTEAGPDMIYQCDSRKNGLEVYMRIGGRKYKHTIPVENVLDYYDAVEGICGKTDPITQSVGYSILNMLLKNHENVRKIRDRSKA